MSKIIFVTGIPGAGKSTYIKNKYSDKEKYFIMDMAEHCLGRFGNLEPLKDEDYGEDRLSIINGLTDEGFFALFDGKDLVIEHNVVSDDLDEFFDLVYKANGLGFQTEWVHLYVELEVAQKRIQSAGDSYYFSEALALDVLMVLEGILEDYQLNVQLEELAVFTGPKGNIRLFKKQTEQEIVFFFVEEHAGYSGFIGCEDLEGKVATDSMVLYNNFNDVVASIYDQYGAGKLSLISIKENLKPVLKRFLDGRKDIPYWDQFLN
ncbi:hypothetical protein [Cecembia calidifontis]|uniref:Uncharacterized protein n=1 Tax=Cecembia calidifontis TaxID=1187080 RepID=A0A4Q7P5I1_9BACT|nr:hypothetical protein [Cecembia calidifontis]RZS94720.1 hypothetical protein BC751_0228 [Cecembia calidifontis]